jgi:putative Mn2+ efflux pump MntP
MKWRTIKITSVIIALVAFLNMIIQWMVETFISAKELKIQEWVSFFFVIMGIIIYFFANEKDEFSK